LNLPPTPPTPSQSCVGTTGFVSRWAGSGFDNAAAEAFFSTLEWEVLSRHEFTDPDHAQRVAAEWCSEFYNTKRRHSSAAMMTPAAFEATAALRPEAA